MKKADGTKIGTNLGTVRYQNLVPYGTKKGKNMVPYGTKFGTIFSLLVPNSGPVREGVPVESTGGEFISNGNRSALLPPFARRFRPAGPLSLSLSLSIVLYRTIWDGTIFRIGTRGTVPAGGKTCRS